MRKFLSVLGVGAAIAALGVSAPVRNGHACMNGVELEVEKSTMLVAQAEGTTNRGFHADALKLLAPMFPQGKPRADFLGARAKLVVARAIARTGGRHGLGGVAVESDEAARSNLHLAGRFVQERLLEKPDDPGLRTDYAEVLAQIPEKQPEARKILVELEKKDLMTSAYGYAALARLRSTPRKNVPSWLDAPLQTLDRAPRVIDLARCERMAVDDGVCARASNAERPAPSARVGSPPPSRARPNVAPEAIVK